MNIVKFTILKQTFVILVHKVVNQCQKVTKVSILQKMFKMKLKSHNLAKFMILQQNVIMRFKVKRLVLTL